MLKCTAFFTLRNGGWSESYFREGTNASDGANRLLQLIGTRLGMLCTTVNCIGGRVAVIENPSIVRSFNLALVGTLSVVSDVLNTAVLWKAQAASGVRRQIWTRGAPDGTIEGGQYTPSSTFSLNANTWAQNIYNDGWCIRTQNRTSFALQDVQSVGTTGILTTFVDPGFLPGDKVKFYKARDSLGRAITGVFSIAAKTSDTTYQLTNWTAGRTAFNVRARKYVLVLEPITLISVNKVGSRRTGRPFGLPVGRARAPA